MNTKTKKNFKRTLSVFLTLLMLLSAWVFVAPSAAATGDGPMIARYFSTAWLWPDAVTNTNQISHVTGHYGDVQSDGSHYFDGSLYLKIDTQNLFSGISADTGIAFSYQWKPDQTDQHRHIISLGANEYTGTSNANSSFYISATTSWMSNSKSPFVGYVDGNGNQWIGAYPASAPNFESGKTYNIVVSISASEGVVFYINGVKYTAGYKTNGGADSTFEAQRGYITEFLNAVSGWNWHYIGVSRWADGYIRGYLKDLCIYNRSMSLAETLAVKGEGLTPATFSFVPTVLDGNPVSAGYYSNLLYEDYMEFYGEWDISGMNFKLVAPKNLVAVYDGTNNIIVPVEAETWVSNNSENVIHAITSDNAFYELYQNWQGFMDGSGNNYKSWAPTLKNTNDSGSLDGSDSTYFSYQNSGNEGVDPSECQKNGSNFQQNNTGTHRFWWNTLRFNGSFGASEYSKYDADLVFNIFASFKKSSGLSSYRDYSGACPETLGVNHYVLNYKPVYDLLKNGTSGAAWARLAEATGSNAWMYTDQSIADVKTSIEKLLACNPNYYDYASDMSGQVSACASAISAAVTYYNVHPLVKKTGAVYWHDEDDSLLETDPNVAYGDVPTYDGATPTKASGTDYDYSWSGWTPTVAVVSEAETTYTATYLSTPRSYSVSVTSNADGQAWMSYLPPLTPASEATYGTQYVCNLKPNPGAYHSVSAVSVTVDGTDGRTLTQGTDYTVDSDWRVTITNADAIRGNIAIAYTIEANTYDVTVAGDHISNAGTTQNAATYNTAYTTPAPTVEAYYNITDVSVRVGSTNLTETTHYTVNADYSVTIKAASVTGPITVTYVTEAKTYDLTFNSPLDNDSQMDVLRYGSDYTTEPLELQTGYHMNDGENPITLKIGGNTLPAEAYSYNSTTQRVTIYGQYITGSVRVYANASNQYSVTWLNEDGSLIETSTLTYNTVPTHAAPTKENTAEYTYTFGGWKRGDTTYGPGVALPAVTADVTYQAVFNSAKNSYLITWLNDDDSVIDTTTVEYGTVPTHADATKAATAEFTYTFTGWDTTPVAVTGPATYKATFSSTTNSYSITWKNDDGTTIDTTTVEYGQTPTHADASKAADNCYTYTFAGWDPQVVAVTGPATYTATYTSTPKTYTVSVTGTHITAATYSDVPYGTPYDVTLGADAHCHITGLTSVMRGETALIEGTDYDYSNGVVTLYGTAITGNITITATAAIDTYTITWLDDDGSLIDTTTVEYGVVPTHADASKAADSMYSYSFGGWDPAPVAVTGEATYQATFTETPKTYTVSVTGTNVTAATYSNVPYGTNYDVTLAADEHYHVTGLTSVMRGETALTENTDYTYANGVVTLYGTAITGNITITASAQLNAYTITWVLHGGNVTTDAAAGEVPSYDAPSYTENGHVYAFSAWDTEPVAATGNATYTASYAIDPNNAENEHTWGTASYVETVEDDAVVKVTASKSCTFAGCGKTLTEEATVANGHLSSEVTLEPTCSAMGKTTYTATFSDAFETQSYTRDNVAIVADAHTYNNADATFAWAEDGAGGWDYVATIPCALNGAHTPKTVNATVTSSTATADCVTPNDTTYTATGFPAESGLSLPVDYEDKVVSGAVDPNAHDYSDLSGVAYAWVANSEGGFDYVATIPCANDNTHDPKLVYATVTSETANANCTVPGDTTYTATAFPAESGLTLAEPFPTKVVAGATNDVHDWDYNSPIITPPTETGGVWSDGSVVYPCTRNEAHQSDAVAVARANYSAYEAELAKIQGFLDNNDLNNTVKSALQAVMNTPLAQNLVTAKDGVDYDGHTAFDQQSTVDAAVAQMRLALADVLNEYAVPDGEGGYIFNESALQTYSAAITDNLDRNETVSMPAGSVISFAKPGYKLISLTATYGTADAEAGTYTFTNNAETDTVIATYAVDADAVLAAAEAILDDIENYNNTGGYLDDLQEKYAALNAIKDDPAENEQAAQLKSDLQTLVDMAPYYKKDGSSATVTFYYGKDGDIPSILSTTVGAIVTPPENTSYVSAGFTYTVTYWKDAAGHHYTDTFPTATDGAVYRAVYAIYDLYDDLAAIRAAKAKENVADAVSIGEIYDILAQIDTLFAENGVTVSGYLTVQANAVNKETAEGLAFIDTLGYLIDQLQVVSENATPVCDGHVFDYFDQKMPTCTEPGYAAYRVCRLCNIKVGGEVLPAIGHSEHYDRDASHSGALADGTCSWETYTCNHGCGDFYVVPTYVALYSDGTPISGATVTLFVDGHNVSVVADAYGRAAFKDHIAAGQLQAGEYSLTVSSGTVQKTGILRVHNGRVTISIARIDRNGQGGEGEGDSSGSFRCPMCNAYDELRSMAVIGWFIAAVHFFVHMAYRIINSSTSFSGGFSF